MKWTFQKDPDRSGFEQARLDMVKYQLRRRGVADRHVLHAMATVPRHAFVPDSMLEMAYSDGPLPIGSGQTISQPYIVAVMSEALGVKPGMKVLEIGTGSGYQAAVLAAMGLDVYTVEYLPELAQRAQQQLEGLGHDTIHFRTGDGRSGWPEAGPFDGILVTAAPDSLPESLGEQLVVGGKLVIPIGHWSQDLYVYRKNEDGSLTGQTLFAVRFVPLVGG